MLEFRLVGLEGPIVPYVRMTQRSKHADPRARRYLASQQALKIQLRQQMTEKDEYEPLTAMCPSAILWVRQDRPQPNMCVQPEAWADLVAENRTASGFTVYWGRGV